MAELKPPPSRLLEELSRLDWSKFDGLASAHCLPAMGLVLALGILNGEPAAGIVAATGTLAVGFGSFRRLQGSRLLPMLLTSIGMCLAASLGTLVGQSSSLTVLFAGVLGLIYGLVLLFSEDASWIGLQCVIAFLIADAFPAHGLHALIRGSLVMAGGFLQIAFLLLFWRGTKFRSLADDFRACHPVRVVQILWRDIAPTVLAHVHHRFPQMRYAVRLSATLMVAVTLSHLLHQLNRYWLPMTALLVMKPDFYRTYTSSMARVFGTFAGILIASLITLGLHPNETLLWIFVMLFAWSSFALQKVNYGVFTCVLTAFIVFLIATSGLPEATVTANRLLDTALGSLIALSSRALGPRWDTVAVAATPQESHGGT